MSDPFSSPDAELPRDRWGRPLITPPEGGEPVAYQRVTTFVGALEDTYHLSLWSQRMVVVGMAARRDLVLAAAAVRDPSDRFAKRTLNDLAKQAKDAANGSSAATSGTAMHSFSEMVDRGEDVSNVPEEFAADLAAYREAMSLFEIVAIEGFCVRDDLRVGGSYDRILRFTEAGLAAFEARKGRRLTYPDGRVVEAGEALIGDLKTGNVDFGMGKITMQLGTYANSEDYDHTLGTRKALAGSPSKEWGVVIHLPVGGGTANLLFVDLAAGWDTAYNVAPLVHAWRKRKATDLSAPIETVRAGGPVLQTLPERISTASSRTDLEVLYRDNADRWTPGLTNLAKARIAALEAAA